MKTIGISALILGSLFAAACGGKKQPEAQEPAPTVGETTPTPEPEPTEPAKTEPTPPPAPPAPPPPPPPKQFAATVALAPVKGAKVKPQTVTFNQTEGQATAASAPAFEGLAPGKYHLIVHENADCGPNATKAGKPLEAAKAVELKLESVKGTPATLDAKDLAFQLEGDTAIVGRTLVLHADKKGKPGKAVACGPITKSETTQTQ